MKIRVTEVLTIEDALRVGFLSSAGSGTALWSGLKPTAGQELDVEFDLDEVFYFGENLKSSSSISPHITAENGAIYVTAEIIQNADEEWVALKLADSIILIELEEPIAQRSGFVELRTNSIRLYPTNI